jgi:hypothetical protein
MMMESIPRLDSMSPSLAKAFQSGGDKQRQQAALMACITAVSDTGVNGAEIDEAMETLRGRAQGSPNLRSRLEALSADLDDKYHQLSENADQMTPEALLLFRKARAASALAFALSGDGLHEAIYEAISAANDRTAALQSVTQALQR